MNTTKVIHLFIPLMLVTVLRFPLPASGQSEGDIFISNTITNPKPYKGEVIVLTQKLYTRLAIQNIGRLKVPSFNGFWSENIPLDHYQVVQEMYQGKPYNTIVLNSTLLIPQKTGIITIEASSLMIERVTERTETRHIWGGIIQQQVREVVENEIKSSVLKIQVKELPTAGRPESFAGALGDFSIDASLSETTVEAGDPAELRITVQGTGNLKLLDKPFLDLPPGVETFEPETSEKIKSNLSGMSGKRTYTWLLIARDTGRIQIPDIIFCYLNPATGKYTEKKVSGLGFNVVNTGKKKVNTANMGKENIRYLGKDIRYIDTRIYHVRIPSISPGSWIHITGLLLPVFLLTLFLLYFRKYLRIHADKDKLRAQKAKATALSRLKKGTEALRKHDEQEFYNALLASLWGYASDRFGLKSSELSKAKIREECAARGIDSGTADAFLELVATCEYCRYAPAPTPEHLEKMVLTAEECIAALESRLNK